MFGKLKEKIVAGLMAGVCMFAGAGFGVAVEGVSAETSGNTSSVTQGVERQSGTPVPTSGAEGFGNTSSVTQAVERQSGTPVPTSAQGVDAPMMEVISNNVSYSDSVYIIYAVKTNGDYSVQMLFWEELPEAYEKGTESYATTVRRLDTVRGEECQLFYSNGIPAKKMTDTIYSCTYTVIDGVEYYGEPLKYSVVDYVYTVREGGVKERTDKLLGKMLEYGAAAQENFAYHTERLATGNFYKVQVVGGTIADGFTYGRYIENSTITLSAPVVNADGRPFACWKNSKGEEVITKNTFALSVFEDETYTAVYADDFTYELSADGMAYTITGCLNARNEINIPATYNGVKVRYIADKAFQNQMKIKSVYIPDGVIGIGTSAFEGCTALTKVSVPASVRSIGNLAFYGCSALQAINVNANNAIYESLDGVLYSKGLTMLIQYPLGLTAEEFFVPNATTSIAGSAFRNGKTLQRVYIGEQVTFVGASAFKNCGTLTVYCSMETQPEGWDVNWNDGCEVVWNYADVYEYTSDGSGITITKYVGDYAIVRMPKVIDGLPVVAIGADAFKDCDFLTTLTLPDTLTSIGSGAFSGCSGLTEIVIPEGVTSIGSSAFSGCSSLEEMTIPFVGGSRTSSYKHFGYIFGGNSYVPTSLVKVTITSATSIAYQAFYRCLSLKSVLIGDAVTSIGEYAFYNCSNLTSVIIGDGVTSIGEGAFNGCAKLSTVTIPDNVTNMGDHVFSGCGGLENVVIGNGVTAIGKGTFWSCSSLTSISIGDGVMSIGLQSFDACGKMENIHIKDIAVWCSISGLSNLMTNGAVNKKLYLDGELVTELLIPDGVTSIGGYAFQNCSSLTSVTIGGSVTSIGDYAFRGCSSLTSVVIPDSVTSIGGSAFSGCSNLMDIYITDVGAWCGISGLSSLMSNGASNKKVYVNNEIVTEIIIPDGVTSIPSYAFYRWSSLTSVEIPDSVTSIGDDAFYKCSSLTSVEIPDSVTSIGRYAFEDCSSLTSVVIPDSVTSIGYQAFYKCSSLTSVEIPDSVTSIGDGSFRECSSLTSVVIPDSVTSIGSYAFYNCSGLTSVEISNGVTSIGEYAFRECSSLTSVVIPDSVTSIGEWAFAYCSSLTSVVIGDGVTSIGGRAFRNCSSLTSVEIGDSVTSIGSGAFQACTSLTSVVIPDSVTSIGDWAFYYCNSLTSVTFENTNGWLYASSSSATTWTTISSADLSNASTAATYLRSTYYIYYWKRSE